MEGAELGGLYGDGLLRDASGGVTSGDAPKRWLLNAGRVTCGLAVVSEL